MTITTAVVDEQRLIMIYMAVTGCTELHARSVVFYHLEELGEKPAQGSLGELHGTSEKLPQNTDPDRQQR